MLYQAMLCKGLWLAMLCKDWCLAMLCKGLWLAMLCKGLWLPMLCKGLCLAMLCKGFCLLYPQFHHFKGFQSVMAILANASVAMGLESVVESWVSVMEYHNNPRRSLTQARIEQECMEAINVPKEVHCDSLVMEGLATYWGRQTMAGNKQGHWVRSFRGLKGYAVSGPMDNIVNYPADVPFML